MQAQQGWQEVSTNIPAFYKSYQDLSFLASVLGVSRYFVTRVEGKGTYADCDIYISPSNKAYIQNNGTNVAEFPVTVLV